MVSLNADCNPITQYLQKCFSPFGSSVIFQPLELIANPKMFPFKMGNTDLSTLKCFPQVSQTNLLISLIVLILISPHTPRAAASSYSCMQAQSEESSKTQRSAHQGARYGP